MGSDGLPLRRELSEASSSRLATLSELERKVAGLEQSVRLIESEAMAHPAESRGTLAQVVGTLDKVQYQEVDAVVTADLKSGKSYAKHYRKAIHARIEAIRAHVGEIQGRLDVRGTEDEADDEDDYEDDYEEEEEDRGAASNPVDVKGSTNGTSQSEDSEASEAGEAGEDVGPPPLVGSPLPAPAPLGSPQWHDPNVRRARPGPPKLDEEQRMPSIVEEEDAEEASIEAPAAEAVKERFVQLAALEARQRELEEARRSRVMDEARQRRTQANLARRERLLTSKLRAAEKIRAQDRRQAATRQVYLEYDASPNNASRHALGTALAVLRRARAQSLVSDSVVAQLKVILLAQPLTKAQVVTLLLAEDDTDVLLALRNMYAGEL